MSEFAQHLIAENKRSQAKHLDLSNCELYELPAELAELTWLESLTLSFTLPRSFTPAAWFRWADPNEEQFRTVSGAHLGLVSTLEPLRKLANLRFLAAESYTVDDLEPLAELTRLEGLMLSAPAVTSLAALRGLRSLRALGVRAAISDLRPLGEMTSLESLHLWLDAEQFELAPLRQLTQLSWLGISSKHTVDIAPVAHLTSLRALALARVQLADDAPLSELSSLQELMLSRVRRPLWRSEKSSNYDLDLDCLRGLRLLSWLRVCEMRIAQLAALTGLDSLMDLDLSNSTIGDFGPIAGLGSLRSLCLDGTGIAELAPVAKLTSLRELDLCHTEVSTLAPLCKLTKLERLRLGGLPVSNLEPLMCLTELRQLVLFGTRVTDLAPLAALTRLEELDLESTRVADLRTLQELKSLRAIDLAQTDVSDVSALARLPELETLVISDTKVKSLAHLRSAIERGVAVHWDRWPHARQGIFVYDCPLTVPPAEIARQGNAAVLNYFRARDDGQIAHLYEAKVLILGEGGAGKTSLLRRLYQPELPLPSEQETTKGIAIYRHEFDWKGQRFRLNVWDFGGQEIYHATHQFFLTRRSLYVLLDDTRKDHKSVSDEGFKYWLEMIDVFSAHSPVLIFQNEKGGRSKAIDFAGIKSRYDNVKELHAGDLDVPSAAAKLQAAIEYHASRLGHIGEELPAQWVVIRAKLEARAEEVPYIDQSEYFEIYGEQLHFDRQHALRLSRYLHDLGVFLHFQDDKLLARTIVLQNEWATEAVFRVVDDECVKSNLGRFTAEDCERLWQDRYEDKHPELLALMQRFELCFLLADIQPPTWLAPQLLPPAKPSALAEWKHAEDLCLRYQYEFMPKGLVSRLTVRLHRFVRQPDMAWTTGALFERHGTSLLVEALPNGRALELRARGPEKKLLSAVVSAELDTLNDSFHGLRDRIDKCVPCRCTACRSAPDPEFYEVRKLLKRKENRRMTVECERSYEQVDVLELLDGLREGPNPAWLSTAMDRSPQRVRIFLASSSELRKDRDALELYLRQQNDHMPTHQLEVVRWENFLDAMSATRLQDEYNAAVRSCDIFVTMFWTKTGRYTAEEFRVAHEQFKRTGRPRIYTYFRDPRNAPAWPDETMRSLLDFRERLQTLDHYPTEYSDIEHLKRHFRDQLDRLLFRDNP